MKILDRIEDLIENTIEGIFRRKSSRPIQPVEIGKKLLKVIDARKRISIAKTYVPNRFKISLHSHQFQEIESFHNTLIKELKGVIETKAEKEELSFIGDLDICFEADQDLDQGAILVDATFLENNNAETNEYFLAQDNQDESNTQVFAASNQRLAYLTYRADGETIIYRLDRKVHSIGRCFSCDLIIEDQNISRVHARLKPENYNWKISDNNSTNGIFVNNNRITEHVLADEDRIRLGTTNITFRNGEH